ncbi:enoyl-CoA hydratase/isomerase family protein [Streptomyces sp. TE5632]
MTAEPRRAATAAARPSRVCTMQRVGAGQLAEFLTSLRYAEGPMPRHPVLVDLDDAVREGAPEPPQVRPGLDPILVGVSTAVPGPAIAALSRSLTFTIAPGGVGRSWVDAPVDETVEAVASTFSRAPVASSVLDRTLRASENLPVVTALELESAAYSMLLASPEFADWRRRTPRGTSGSEPAAVVVERDGPSLVVELNRPARHNAFNHAMRDGVLEALSIALADDSIAEILLRGRGPSYCSGGDLDEFGSCDSPAAAHLVRLEQSVGHVVHLLRERVVPTLHGACIGAGIEIPAFASRVRAVEGSWFQLPELSMGLIPGAGGTVGIPRRIGRWRTAFLALTGQRIDVATALDWGLVDERH